MWSPVSRTLSLLALLGWLVGPQAAWAQAEQRIDHLYRALIPLPDRTERSQSLAMESGLARVLEKVSGYSGVTRLPGVQDELRQARSLASEFGIQSLQIPAEEGVGVEMVDALRVAFPESAVNAILRRHELPVWPSSRRTQAYLYLSDLSGRPEVLGEELFPAGYAWLRRVAFDRGVPVTPVPDHLLPRLSASALWRIDRVAASILLAELDVDQLVLVRIHASDPGRIADISRVDRFGVRTQELPPGPLITGLTLEFNAWADAESLRTAFVSLPQATGDLRLVIERMSGFGDYRQIVQFLAGVEQISSHRLVFASADRLEFELGIRSGTDQVRDSLVRSGFLQSRVLAEDSPQLLRFSYRPGTRAR